MTKDTIFDLASLTKPLATTLAVMKLVQEGKLETDSSLGSILPAMQEYRERTYRDKESALP